MKDNKVVLTDEELDRDYLVTDPKKNRFSTKFIDIFIACFGIISCGALAYLFFSNGLPYNEEDRIIKGSVYAGVAIFLLIWIIVIAKAKSLKFIGGIYPFTLMVFSVTTATVTSVQRLIAGESLFRTGNIWNIPIVYICMSVLAIISFILYCLKATGNNPRLKMAAFALCIFPTLAMMKNQSTQLLGYFGEYMGNINMLLTWDGFIRIGSTLVLLGDIVAIIYGYAMRLIDRGDNLVHVAPRVVEKPVLVTQRTKRGLLIVKSKKEEEAAPEPEPGEGE